MLLKQIPCLFHKAKTQYPQNRNEDLDLKIRDNKLEIIQKTKYLGVQVDNSLNWKEPIKTVSTKVSRAVGFSKHAKTFLPLETLKTLSTGIIEPLSSQTFDIVALFGVVPV